MQLLDVLEAYSVKVGPERAARSSALLDLGENAAPGGQGSSG